MEKRGILIYKLWMGMPFLCYQNKEKVKEDNNEYIKKNFRVQKSMYSVPR